MTRLALAALVLLLPAVAAASAADDMEVLCSSYRQEILALERLAVREGGQRVDAPPGLPATGELLLYTRGELLLITKSAISPEDRTTVFDTSQPIEPSPTQRKYLEWLAQRLENPGICDNIDFLRHEPVLPGRYTFAEETGAEPHGFAPTAVTVSADRHRVTLDFMAAGHTYAAEYTVLCAYFRPDRGQPRRCAPKDPPPDPPPSRGCATTPPSPGTTLTLLALFAATHRRRPRRDPSLS